MSEDMRKLTCEEFQNQIAELIGFGVKIEDHPHMRVCTICSQLLHELQTIAENSRHFRFGVNESDPDDWSETFGKDLLDKVPAGKIGMLPYRLTWLERPPAFGDFEEEN